MSDTVSSAVDELQEADAGGTLRDAFDEADSCQELREEGS